MAEDKLLLRALKREKLPVPPIWIMRQAGRYLPEYRAIREKAGDFISLCLTSELAAEVTLQPIQRYGFDAAILFADILLVPYALGSNLCFVTGEGPKLSTITTDSDFNKLGKSDDIHDMLDPVYNTLRILRSELPEKITLIGFAGAPWTVATYMIAGKGTPDQKPAHSLMVHNKPLFDKLMKRLTKATISYLKMQVSAGAECIKIFDSWAGSLRGNEFEKYAIEPCRRIVTELKQAYPHIPVIGFPRNAGLNYVNFASKAGVDCIAVDNAVDSDWAARNLQVYGCVQGNLAPDHLVTGGQALIDETRRIKKAFSHGSHIFNLGHGITPDADPKNVQVMIDTIRENV
ncbi:MAG: uroporphyrinogen decarboxylase [Aestuariivita sp.]|nr:uroporphyrinogen decarboxylase [Aestuariivita sp.]